MNAPLAQTSPTVMEVVEKSALYLAERGVPAARADAERLVAHGLGMKRLDLYLAFDRPVAETELAPLRELVARRGRREPLQQVVGGWGFRELSLVLTGDVLVPRPETEEVVEAALAEYDRMGRGLSVLDLGTGSGCIALSVAHERPCAAVTAVDISEKALSVARENEVKTGLSGRVRWLCGDLYRPVAEHGAGRFDLIISNPPYLTDAEWAAAPPEIKNHEPKAALAAGADGLDAYRGIFTGARDHLTAGGCLVVEIGAAQGAAVSALALDAGFGDCTVRPDLSGRDRMVVARAGNGQEGM